MGQLAPQRRPELLHVALAHNLEQHIFLLLLGLAHCALLRLFQVAHLLDVLEVLYVLHELFVLFRARCQFICIYLLLFREELVRMVQ